MFTGIVESQGEITKIDSSGTNKRFWIKSAISHELKVDQSVSHDGVCLTVEEVTENGFRVSAVEETLRKTNLSNWGPGKLVNLERAMILGGRLDGHLVQGHVDTTATCILREDKNGSWLFRFSFPKQFAHLVIEKGSIAVNGTSLTAFDVADTAFSVAIIPYTFNHTSIREVQQGTIVNIEFDMLGKYITRWKELDKSED
jgi:riboflavin synthase